MLFSRVMVAQVAISSDNSSPDNSAMLDVKSNSKGLLIPRLTTAQRTSMSNPAEGLMVYDTDMGLFYYRHSGLWTILSGSSSGWSLTGNSLSGSEIFGSTNSQPVKFYSNNIERMRITETGNVGIGSATAVQRLSLGASADDAAIQMFCKNTFPPPVETNPTNAAGTYAPGGYIQWLTPMNALISDNVYAQAVFSSPAFSDFLIVSGFGFNIPANASITGIEVFVQRNSPVSSTIQDNMVYLVKAGVQTGNNKALPGYWTGTNTVITYGSSSDTWGTTWLPADINAANFGVQVSVQSSAVSIANIDYIGIKVYCSDYSSWTVGMDYSDGFKFKVSSSSVLGTNDKFSVGPDGLAQFAGRVKGQDAVDDNDFITKGQLASGSLPSQWMTHWADIYNTNSGNVGIGTSSPNSSAKLEVNSTTSGLLMPRLTPSQIVTISYPAAGLMVYNTCSNTFYYYNGTHWVDMNGNNPLLSIGDTYAGGIVFYLQPGSDCTYHGIVCAPYDQNSAPWGCYGTWLGGTSLTIGTGQANTTAILNGCSESGIAARVCDNLVLNGYNDWYLPSLDELNLMADNLAVHGIGGFIGNGDYWSSSEYSNNSAYGEIFSINPSGFYSGKYHTYSIRAVRAF